MTTDENYSFLVEEILFRLHIEKKKEEDLC